jgi:hypothetical protein
MPWTAAVVVVLTILTSAMLVEEFFLLSDKIETGSGIDARLADGHLHLRSGLRVEE